MDQRGNLSIQAIDGGVVSIHFVLHLGWSQLVQARIPQEHLTRRPRLFRKTVKAVQRRQVGFMHVHVVDYYEKWPLTTVQPVQSMIVYLPGGSTSHGHVQEFQLQ